VPFLKFVANKGINDRPRTISFVLRGMSRPGWPMSWSELDRIKLTDLVSSGKSASRSRPCEKYCSRTLFAELAETAVAVSEALSSPPPPSSSRNFSTQKPTGKIMMSQVLLSDLARATAAGPGEFGFWTTGWI